MSEPARVHHLHEARALSPEASAALVKSLEETQEDNAGLRAQVRSLRRANTKLRREMEDLLEDAADAGEVETFLTWWRDHTGRGAGTVVTTSALERTRAYRRLRRKFSQREVALMVVAAMRERWRVDRGLTDIPDLEKRADDLLAEGLRIQARKGQA